jgi:hypothetical protein
VDGVVAQRLRPRNCLRPLNRVSRSALVC